MPPNNANQRDATILASGEVVLPAKGSSIEVVFARKVGFYSTWCCVLEIGFRQRLCVARVICGR
jgi:hypothetical protein